MIEPIEWDGEPLSNRARAAIAKNEPVALRTYTPTQAVFARSSGLYHYTPEGRRLADFSSGVLVSNLGHNPKSWFERLAHYMQWTPATFGGGEGFVEAPTLTAYNAITTVEAEAVERLLASLRRSPFGGRLEKVMWSASGSEGIQKSLWAALHYQPDKDIILATRHGFHGKKGLAGAVTGDESSPDRDPRVRFISFPKRECFDVSLRNDPFDPTPYRQELEQLARTHKGRLNCLITEPYLGGGGSFHPPKDYLNLLVGLCREHGLVFILDEVQSNFGRTGSMYAFETYEIEPDIVVLGKGMGNGVPVNAAVGRADVLDALTFGQASDTWSAHPLGCAATLATLDVFEREKVIDHVRSVAPAVERALCQLKETNIVAAVRGEGMVWGVEFAAAGDRTSAEIANDVVRSAYQGDENGDAIHLLGPLAGNVIRVSPPLTMTRSEIEHWFGVLYRVVERVAANVSLAARVD